MKEQRKRSWWRSVLGGVVAKFGISTVLVGVAVFGGRAWAAFADAPQSWTEHMGDATSESWFLLQAINLLSAGVGGWVAAWLAPPRSWLGPGALVLLFASAAVFAQIPGTRSPVFLGIWALGAPIGAAIGAVFHRRHEAQA